MTFHARHQVEVLLDGLDILRLQETEQDGHAFSGPKHWHTFDILASRWPGWRWRGGAGGGAGW